ncbi:toxin-antitoxin system HicB family antitoxin [Robbsia andropogonis]|uniref:toxin-antitoxin system HicB family antitoxin n=1 Tax=Robbsia andropogonis TaxID=28092 RepID=UPI003D223011
MNEKADAHVKLQLRIPVSLHAEYARAAQEASRSLNGQLVFALRGWIEGNKKESPTNVGKVV